MEELWASRGPMGKGGKPNRGGPLHHWVEYMEKYPDAFLTKVWATVQIATEQQNTYAESMNCFMRAEDGKGVVPLQDLSLIHI